MKIVQGTLLTSHAGMVLRLSLERPLTPTEQTALKRKLEEYFENTGDHFGFATEGKVFDLIPSGKTERDAEASSFREAVQFLIDDNKIAVEIISGRRPMPITIH